MIPRSIAPAAALALFALAVVATDRSARAGTDSGAGGPAGLAELERTLAAMEDRLRATSDALAAAEARSAELADRLDRLDRGGPAATSALEGLLAELEVGGWVSASYWYNLNDPDNNNLLGANQGLTGFSHPFTPDANQFSFDQLWIELERPVSPERRAGFRADLAFGKIAGLLPAGNTPGGGRAGGNNFYVGQAYVQVLAETPIGDVRFQAGKFFTTIGAEVAQATGNPHISRSNVYNLMQPIDHVGVAAFHERSCLGVACTLGVLLVNGFGVDQPEINDGKTLILHTAFDLAPFSLALNLHTGHEAFGDEGIDTRGINAVLGYDDGDRITGYLDAGFVATDGPGGTDPKIFGVAASLRYAITERLGLALRADLVGTDRDFVGVASALAALRAGGATQVGPGDPDESARFWSLTGTVDYRLADGLLLRGELRYDRASVDRFSDDLFISDGDRLLFGAPSQLTAGAEVIYTF